MMFYPVLLIAFSNGEIFKRFRTSRVDFKKLFQWENSVIPVAERSFFRSVKETSKIIPDVRIGKVVPMKKREIRNICSGCLAR